MKQIEPRTVSEKPLEKRLLPGDNPDRADRRIAWEEWQCGSGQVALERFIRYHNQSAESDEDILQETLLCAFLEVERGRYQPQEGIPFTAYVKGIARNKLREAIRLQRNHLALEDIEQILPGSQQLQPETASERREQKRLLLLGLTELPDKRRQVLERLMRGETTTEIANKLAMSEELVRQHKCRGLRSLRSSQQIAARL